MQSKAKTATEYVNELPSDRKKVMVAMRNALKQNLPKGFAECMSYGMINYVVPHSLYPNGYHVTPEHPLPFVAIASQKNYITLYHMALYEGSLLEWFQEEWKEHSTKKLDMGKCCVRFKKPEDVPIALIEKLAEKMTPQQWINHYEAALKSNTKSKKEMKRVTGLGGVFFKSDDPAKTREWYKKHLGMEGMNDWGFAFPWREVDKPNDSAPASTAWNPFKKDTDYFSPSQKQFMFNYRVENLVELLKVLKEEGVQIVGEIQEYPYGKFGWIMDPEGNKIELWEPKDD